MRAHQPFRATARKKFARLATWSDLATWSIDPSYCTVVVSMGCCASTSSGALAEPVAAQPAVINSKPQGVASKNPLAFSNKPATAVGDANIPANRRVKFGLIMPESTGVGAVHMFFDKEKPVEKMIAGIPAGPQTLVHIHF